MNMFWFLHKEMQAIVIGFTFRQLSQQEIRQPIENLLFDISFQSFKPLKCIEKIWEATKPCKLTLHLLCMTPEPRDL